MKTYSILEGNMDRLRKKITRIQNKCRKYGCDFHFAEIGEELREVRADDGNYYKVRCIIVEAEGIAEVNGWKFIASVEHTPNGNIIKKACDVEVPSEYYTSVPMCEHCNSRRYRKDTFIILNEETGEFMQVGRNCLCDFTHGMSAEGVASYISAFDEIIEGEAMLPGMDYERYVDVRAYLQYVSETIRKFGYVKRDRDDLSQKTTADRAFDFYAYDRGWLNSLFNKKDIEEIQTAIVERDFNAESADAKGEVAAALAWIMEQPEDSNYMHNLRTVCSLSDCKVSNLGLLTSLFPTYNRALYRDAERKEAEEMAKKSNWVGAKGQRIAFMVAETSCVTSWETEWGLTSLYKFRDESGNVYVWKTSSWVPEKVLSIVGTVKDHTEYRGEKQTELTRCRIAKAV